MDDQDTLTMLRDRAPRAALDVPVAEIVSRGSALRRRRRRGQLGTASLGVAVAAIAAVGVVTVHGHLETTHLEPAASAPAPFTFTVIKDTAAESAQSPCVAVLHFAADTVPGSSDLLSCDDDYAAQDAQLRAGLARGTVPFTGSGEDPTLAPVSSRDDRVTVAGHRSTVVSGTAPAGTVAVIATDESGRHLTATLVRTGFTPLIFWAFDTTGHKLTGVQYVLADGHHSIEEELSFS
jgi:hypothetical protein